MMGSTSQAGMVPQTVEDVFAYIREASVGREFLLRVSYMEIYNETIRDLLAPEVTDLRIHEDKTRGVYVSPLKEEIVTTAKQVMKIIQKGEAIRHVSETDYNLHSSRSHTIFQMVIESRDRLHSTSGSPSISRRYVNPSMKGQGPVRVSQLNLIDLAGSEKASSSAERRKEGSFINKSLLTLGTVISKLTEPNSGHIPFRDSKLTRILQTSLSGNARVSVICAINPSVCNIEESHNTLKFATRLKKVSTKAQPNQVLDDKALLQKYKVEITELKTKLIRMNAQVDSQEVEALKREKAKYEEDRMEMELVRTALKERIDHLTKLILTSSTIASKPILDWSETGSRRALPADGTPVARQQEQLLRTELAEKDEIIARLQRQLEGKEKYSETLRSLLEDEKAPASPTAHTSSANTAGSTEVTLPTGAGDVQARYVRGELQQLRRTNNELRQLQQEQEAKIRSLRVQLEGEKSRRGADADHSAARRERDKMAQTLEEQRIVILELENECDELRGTVAQLRNSLAQLQMTRFEIDEASVSAVRSWSSDSPASRALTSVSATSVIAQPSAPSSSSATTTVVHLKDLQRM